MLERGMFYQMKRGGRKPVPQINTGIMVDGAANAPSTPPPALGEHTRSVLSDLLDYGYDDFKTLEAEGVIPASEGE
jgi:crotonobetainyl-CoA:carnitine CoA-transferase CaiB-like acyl-CoA transferase